MVPPARAVPPPRRRAALGTGRPRTGGGSLLSTPVQEVDIPTTYTLAPTNGAGPPTRALHHFVVTRLRPSRAGPAGIPASLCELDEPSTELAAGGVLMAPGQPPLTVSLPRLSGWSVEVGGDEPRLLATTPTGQYRLVGRPAGSYVATHGRARRRFELLVRSVALATRLPPADATYAKIVRQLGRRAAGMRAYSEADVLVEAPYLLAQSRRLDDPALRCSLFAQELARRSAASAAAAKGAPSPGRRAWTPSLAAPVSMLCSTGAVPTPPLPLSPSVRPSAAKPPTAPPARLLGSRGLSPRRASLSPPITHTLPVAMRSPLRLGSPVSPPTSPPPLLASAPSFMKRKRVSGDGGGRVPKRRSPPSVVPLPPPAAASVRVGGAPGVPAGSAPCACAGAPGGCGGGAPAAAGSKYASDACGMARARQRVAEMAAAGVDVDSFVRARVEPLSAAAPH